MGYRIVITSWGSFGDVFPYVGLAHALRVRGQTPVLAMPTFYRELIEGEGFEFHPVGPDVDPDDRDLLARVMHPSRGSEVIIRELLIPSLRQSYDALRAVVKGGDLLVTHPITFAAPVVAQQEGLPWVSTVLAPMSFFSATDLPVFPPAPWLINFRRLGPWFGRLMVGLARRATRDWTDSVYELRAGLGLPRGGNPIFEGQFSPTRTLALFSRVLGSPQPDWPPHVETTGFVFYNGPGTLSPELEAFLAAGPPPVVFTLGSSAVGAAGPFYEESAAAAARVGCRAVLLTGGLPENQPSGRISGDVLLVDRAPHQLLFPRAAVIVHQGGVGTTGQALRSGRPMLVVPHGHDQPDNAFRVTNLGVARTVLPPAYRARRVARDLTALMADSRYAQRALALVEEVGGEGGADAGAEALIAVLADRDPLPERSGAVSTV